MSEIISIRRDEGSMVFTLNGRIDSNNAPDIEKSIMDAIAGVTVNVIVDAQKLEYISSAGLRVLLRLRKLHPELKVINVSADVYEIFEMTGFSELMTVEKAYRVLSVDGCEVIGRGANGQVYRYDPETIVKVYFNADALGDIKRERELARKAFVLGIPTAIPYDVVRVGDSYGSVFELLNAKSFSKLIAEDPGKTDEYVGMFVDLMKKIHGTVVQPGDMPDIKQTALAWLDDLEGELPADTLTRLRALFEAVPVSNNMLHGDYHTNNVMLQNGEVLLIDMDTLSRGDPVFELASVYNAYVGFGAIDPKAIENFLKLSTEKAACIWRKTLEFYLGTADPAVIENAEAKAKLVGTVRLLRRTLRRDRANTALIDSCKKLIAETLPKVDSLPF